MTDQSPDDVRNPTVAPRRGRALRVVGAVVGALLVVGSGGLFGRAAWVVYSAATSTLGSSNAERQQPGHLPPGTVSVDDLDISPASDEQKVGVVTIVTDLYYDESSQAAGTGSILTSDGMVLTNNHVIEGSTHIEVTVESSGRTYDAIVLGTDKTNDVALLQLEHAPKLDTVDLDYSAVEVGDTVSSIGNAEGTGDLVVAEGKVLVVNESLSVGDGHKEFESLSGLIEVDADVVSGDSGGPLVDGDGEVVGMVTAASTGSSDIRGYAITIGAAMDIVKQIRSGEETETVHIGPTAFMGVTLAEDQGSDGVTLDGTITGTPADKAGLVAGDVITSVDGKGVLSGDELKALVRSHDPGDEIHVTYTDAGGISHTVTLTLTEGPA